MSQPTRRDFLTGAAALGAAAALPQTAAAQAISAGNIDQYTLDRMNAKAGHTDFILGGRANWGKGAVIFAYEKTKMPNGQMRITIVDLKGNGGGDWQMTGSPAEVAKAANKHIAYQFPTCLTLNSDGTKKGWHFNETDVWKNSVNLAARPKGVGAISTEAAPARVLNDCRDPARPTAPPVTKAAKASKLCS